MNDDEIRGYAAAVLEREFSVKPQAVLVQDGVIRIQADLPASDQEKLKEVLEHIDGVRRVEITTAPTRRVGIEWLPLHAQFKPILADPRWPHFAAAYQYYFEGTYLKNVGSADLGETFALLRYNFEGGGSVELDLQAGVFAIFDLGAESADLVNADYLGAVPISYANGNFSIMGRFLHQSSHLGDEFLLDHQITRINLTYEEFDFLASYELSQDLRLYGGSGYLFDQEPSSLKPWSLQSGAEWVSHDIEMPWGLQPLAALDLQLHQEENWDPQISARAGLQFGKPLGIGRNLQLLVEFFRGPSPNGQFYDERIIYAGLGVDLYF